MHAETAVAQASGDWLLRGSDPDCVFASQQLSDTALSAAVRASAKFHHEFPGWELYRRVVAGVDIHDHKLVDWATTSSRMLAEAKKVSGRAYISGSTREKSGWVAQAGKDALYFAIYGKHASSTSDRAKQLGIDWKTYKTVRNPVAAAMWIGLDTFRAILHAEYMAVRREDSAR